MRKKRENRTKEETIMENEKAKEGMRRMREAQTQDKKAVENEKSRERMRKQKIMQNQKRGKVENQKSKVLLRKFESKEGRDLTDIAERLNEKYRLNKDKSANESQTESNYYEGHSQKLQYKNKIPVRNSEKGALKTYKRKKYLERKTNKREQTKIEGIRYKYKYREKKLKTVIDENEVLVIKKKNQDDLFQDLYPLYRTTEEAKKIIIREYPNFCPEFEKLIKADADQKIELERKNEIVEKEKVTEHCICEYDIDCKYCKDQFENEQNLYADAINTWTELEEQEFKEKELKAIRTLKRIERKKKRKLKSVEAMKPLPPLPIRELSQYEKIREDIINRREKEWVIYEKEWERQKMEKTQCLKK